MACTASRRPANELGSNADCRLGPVLAVGYRERMTTDELASAMAELRLRHDAPFTRAMLGVSGRQIRYYLAGHTPIPTRLENLILILLWCQRTGLPPAAVAARASAPELLGRSD